MVRHAHEAVEFVAGKTWENYREDRQLRRAVERSVQIVGEAARELSDDFRKAHPEVPWRPIIVQRHILVHDYGEIEDDKIWRVATVHLPVLIRLITPLIPPPPPTD
ncbi:MAG TPA: HepT-like ribonuclease domain-containing protein [Phycisphaerales bacterium]|nr:HepT-like ribonuclease domain-containing protein [Phycisphaerales bacterium]